MIGYYNIKINTIFIKDINSGEMRKINYNLWQSDNEIDVDIDIDYLFEMKKIKHVYDKINYKGIINNNIEIKCLTYYFYYI